MTTRLALLAFGIGFVAGSRSFTAPALVAWAARLGWINLAGSHLSFIGSKTAVVIFTLGALGELVTDKLSVTPARTAAFSLTARIVAGSFTGACLSTAGGASSLLGALLGSAGAIAGTFGGYHARLALVQDLHIRDIFIAIPEDILAIGLALFLVSRF